jgi:hypothetical protein
LETNSTKDTSIVFKYENKKPVTAGANDAQPFYIYLFIIVIIIYKNRIQNIHNVKKQ